jgi:hypothetical protein
MGPRSTHRPVLLLAAAFSRYDAALDWAGQTLEAAWGKVALESVRFDHRETTYYEPTMGKDLKKVFFAFQPLIDPANLAERKVQAIAWEDEYRRAAGHPEPRPLNIDPGYLTEAKLVLASTKDRDHRIYLSQGIFAEVTLHFHHGQWAGRPWTYPDYQRADYHEFFSRCREFLRQAYRESARGQATGQE